MSNQIIHPFHLCDESPWPILASISAIGLTTGLSKWFHLNDFTLIFIRLVLLVVTARAAGVLALVDFVPEDLWRASASDGTCQCNSGFDGSDCSCMWFLIYFDQL